MNAFVQHPSGATVTGLGFGSSGFQPGIHGPKMGDAFLDSLTDAGDVYGAIKQAEADEAAAEAQEATAKALVEAERLRLEQERLRQQGKAAGAEGELISGVPNWALLVGAVGVVGVAGYAYFK